MAKKSESGTDKQALPWVTARTLNYPEYMTTDNATKRIRIARMRDDTCKGLYLQITKQGSRSFVLRYRSPSHRHEAKHSHGLERWLGLGAVGEVSLAGAIALAAARAQIRQGIDPVAERQKMRAERALQQARPSITFEQATRQYLDQHEEAWRNKRHRQQWWNSLRDHAFSVLGALNVADIDRAAVLRVLEPIWTTMPETASRVRGRIERVLGWAKMHEYRPEGSDNPAAWKDRLEHALPKRSAVAKVKHHAVMDYGDLPEFMAELAQRDSIAARALCFTILTAARTSEVTQARWAEFDLPNRVWTIPAERMKMHREHRVPLSDAALLILEKLPREGDYVFVGARRGKPISSAAMAEVLQRMEIEATVNGFRSSFKDWASETTGFPNEVTEMALAHAVKNRTEAAYRRGDLLQRRAKLMQQWPTTAPAQRASAAGWCRCGCAPARPDQLAQMRRLPTGPCDPIEGKASGVRRGVEPHAAVWPQRVLANRAALGRLALASRRRAVAKPRAPKRANCPQTP
jgi:integrase